jgi:hypothetical protein
MNKRRTKHERPKRLPRPNPHHSSHKKTAKKRQNPKQSPNRYSEYEETEIDELDANLKENIVYLEDYLQRLKRLEDVRLKKLQVLTSMSKPKNC